MTQVTDHIVDANKMLTAVEWLIWELIDSGLFEGNVMPNSMLFKNAKQIEKEQMIEFAEEYNMYLLKCKKGIRGSVVEMSAEQYYNETFKK